MIQELRIGNFVSQLYSFGCDGTKKPEWREWELDLIDIQDVQSRPEIYKPIPLTEEWLFKMGFRKDKDGLTWHLNHGLWMSIGKNQFFAFGSSKWSIKYVHQLQNLYFALTGKELRLNDK